jgi:hypothetical protein
VPERAWNALALLDSTGVLAQYPELMERWEELTESLDEDWSLEALAAQIEDEPEGLWLALQALAVVERPVRAQIIEGLAARTPKPGPGLVSFLRYLCFANDTGTRTAALEALSVASSDYNFSCLESAWRLIAEEHPDPTVCAQARRWLRRNARRALARAGAAPPPKTVPMDALRSLVTAIDGRGRGTIVLCAKAAGGAMYSSAAFLADVRCGIREVYGLRTTDQRTAESFLDEVAEQCQEESLHNATGFAVGLLRACLSTCTEETSPALRFWLEATLGPRVTAQCFPVPYLDWDSSTLVPEAMARRAGLVLAACPGWIDASPLTHDLAEEILFREGDSFPDPGRDTGAYRYLFEHRLRGELEFYRRMLLWMALFWQASGANELSCSALALASQLSDEQHAVPCNPFTVELTSRSLAAAQANLRAGIDPRRAKKTSGA